MTGIPEFASREGMVTVYDADGRYLGCMGVEFWAWLLPRDHEQIVALYDELTRLRAENERLREAGEALYDDLAGGYVHGGVLTRWREASSGAGE